MNNMNTSTVHLHFGDHRFALNFIVDDVAFLTFGRKRCS